MKAGLRQIILCDRLRLYKTLLHAHEKMGINLINNRVKYSIYNYIDGKYGDLINLEQLQELGEMTSKISLSIKNDLPPLSTKKNDVLAKSKHMIPPDTFIPGNNPTTFLEKLVSSTNTHNPPNTHKSR